QEKWVLRHVAGHEPIRADADALYDSAAVAHDTRWDLPLPGPEETLGYLGDVRDRVLEWLGRAEPDQQTVYFTLLCVFHEDMHAEAFTYARQTLGYAPPRLGGGAPRPGDGAGSLAGDVEVHGGTFLLGATP